MTGQPEPRTSTPAVSRRSFLSSSAAIGLPGVFGARYARRASFEDDDGDGIPDELERSEAFHDRMVETFGAGQFDGLDPTRRDLLVDARIVGDHALDPAVTEYLERLFRDNGIHLQWLNHPVRYDATSFREAYGHNARKLLWGRGSFYRREVDSDLKNIAFQLVITPGKSDEPNMGRIYSPFARFVMRNANGGWVNGMNTGNRAVIGYRESQREQARLALHEIAHLVLPHDNDPTNRGVMGTHEEIDLTADEWHRFRNGLGAIRDRTGYDVAFRRCLWEEQAEALLS